MRGLKLARVYVIRRELLVASFTDAWIETLTPLDLLYANWSHLLQMRGLKHFCLYWKHHGHKSHLLQMRGLKP